MSSPITNLKVQRITNQGPNQEPGWYFLQQDLNHDAGGDYLYAGYRTDPGTPITSLNFFAASDPQKSPQAGWRYWDPTDLNEGASGDYIYMEWNTGEAGKDPIINLMFLLTKDRIPTPIEGWTQVGVDLNSGAGGVYIWAYYSTTVSPSNKNK